MPTTGPFIKVDVNSSTRWRRRESYRQTKPRKLRLKYVLRDQTNSLRTGVAFNGLNGSDTTYTLGTAFAYDQQAYNLAYAKLVEAAGKKASWAVSLAESGQAVDMIRKRASQIIAFSRALRKGRFGDAADALDWPRSKQRPNAKHLRKKDLSGRYLEFHFGWSPLMSDIYESVGILGRDFNPIPLRGRGRSSGFRQDLSNEPRVKETVVTKCQILADVNITNPNTLLLSQLGLANPALVVWELVPYSFVVDWFVNVSEFLSHYTDFSGMALSNIAVTYYRTIDNEAFYSGLNGWPQNTRIVRKWIWLDRNPTPSLVGPALSFHPWKGFSVRRGLAAMSLLVQNLPKR